MAAHKFFNNFTGGEWTPKLDGRSDLAKYDAACRTLENWRVLQYGGVQFRTGFEYVTEAYLGSFGGTGLKTFLIPFQFSTTTRFVLLLSNNRIYFISNGVLVPDPTHAVWDSITGYATGTIVSRTVSGVTTYWKALTTIPSQTPPAANGAPEVTPAQWVQATDDEWGLYVTSPYNAFDSFQVQYKQINDVMYLTHPDYPVHKLSRLSDTSWTMAEVDWTYPPFLEENTGSITVTPSATTGTGITITASSALFNANHVGAYWEIGHLREANSVNLDISGTSGSSNSSTMTVKGDWTVVTSNYWYGELLVQRSYDGGTTWETIRKFTSESDRNVSASGSEETECLLRLRYTANGDPFGSGVWAGTAPTDYVYAKATLESEAVYKRGFVKITGYTSDTVVTADVKQALANTTATDIWAEGAYSDHRGHPRAVGLYEQRLYFGGTDSNPIRFWGSKTGDFENFEYGTNDDQGVSFDMAATEGNVIQWMEALKFIQAGTSGGEFAISSGNLDEPITPSNVSVKGHSAYGSDAIQARAIDDVVLFVHRQGTRVHEMAYSIEREGYVAPDLTVLAEHILGTGAVQMAFARLPDPTLYVVTEDGDLAVFTYSREQNITAWTRWTTEGEFESVATIYGDPADEVWVCVKRTVNGTVKRFVERLADYTTDKTAAVHLDSAVSGTGSLSGTDVVVDDLDHLEGEVVGAVADGGYLGEFTVSGGEITIGQSGQVTAVNVVVGLQYTGTLKPMKLDTVIANGPSQGRKRRITEAAIRFMDTLGCKFGKDTSDMEEIPFRSEGDPMDASPPLFTGDKIVKWKPGHDREANVILQQDIPLPCTVLGIAMKYDVFGE